MEDKIEYEVTRRFKMRGLSIAHLLLLEGDIAFLEWHERIVAVLVPVTNESEADGIKEVLERYRDPGGH